MIHYPSFFLGAALCAAVSLGVLKGSDPAASRFAQWIDNCAVRVAPNVRVTFGNDGRPRVLLP